MSYITTALALAASGCILVMACDGENQNRRASNGQIATGDVDGDGVTAPDSTGTGTGDEGTGTEGGTAEGGTAEGAADDDFEYTANPALTYLKNTKTIIDAKCVSCHGATNPKLDTYADVYAARASIMKSLKDGSMPKEGELVFNDKKLIISWIMANAQEGTPPEPITFAFFEPRLPNTPIIGTNYTISIDYPINTFSGFWSLYYSTVPDVTTGGVPLVENQQLAGDGNFVWDTTGLPTGTYYIYGILNEEGQTVTAKAAGSLRKGLPTITLAPAWKAGSKALLLPGDLTYSVVNNLGAGPWTVKVEIKSTAGGAYAVLAAAETDLTKYSVTSGGLTADGVDYYFKISLLNNGAVVSTDESTGPIGLTTTAYTYANLRTDFIGGACDTCHSLGGTNAGNFRSDTVAFDDALGAAPDKKGPNLVSRVHNAGSPMPPSPNSMLTAPEQMQTKLWLWLGGNP